MVFIGNHVDTKKITKKTKLMITLLEIISFGRRERCKRLGTGDTPERPEGCRLRQVHVLRLTVKNGVRRDSPALWLSLVISECTSLMGYDSGDSGSHRYVPGPRPDCRGKPLRV